MSSLCRCQLFLSVRRRLSARFDCLRRKKNRNGSFPPLSNRYPSSCTTFWEALQPSTENGIEVENDWTISEFIIFLPTHSPGSANQYWNTSKNRPWYAKFVINARAAEVKSKCWIETGNSVHLVLTNRFVISRKRERVARKERNGKEILQIENLW